METAPRRRPSTVAALPRAVADALRASRWSLRTAWARQPSAFLLAVGSATVLALTPAAQVQAVAALVRRSGTVAEAAVPLLLLVALIGAGQVLDAVDNFTQQRAGTQLQRSLQDSLVARIAQMSPGELADPATTADIQVSRTALREISRSPWAVLGSLAAVLTLVSLFASMWTIAPGAAVAVVCSIIPSLALFSWAAAYQARIFPRIGEHQRRTTYLLEQLVQQRSGTEIATLGSGARLGRLIAQNQLAADRLMDRVLVGLIRGFSLGGLLSAGLLGVALAVVVGGGTGGVGIAAGVLGVLSGTAATRGAGFALGDVLSTAPDVAVLRRLLDRPATSTSEVVRDVDTLVVDRVTVTYPRASGPALVEASIEVRRGEMVALVGANGAGKTTLVNAITGSVGLDAGRVLVDDQDASGWTLSRRMGHLGLLTQEFGRYELSVREAVSLGLPGDPAVSDRALWRALGTAGLDRLVRGLDDRLDAQLGEQAGGVGLSGGQWQRLALARIVLRDAGLWILDEPTSAVDAEAERELFRELRRSRSDRLTIVVSHRAWTLRDVDRIYVLHDGRIVQSGSYEELAAAPGRFAELFAED